MKKLVEQILLSLEVVIKMVWNIVETETFLIYIFRFYLFRERRREGEGQTSIG